MSNTITRRRLLAAAPAAIAAVSVSAVAGVAAAAGADANLTLRAADEYFAIKRIWDEAPPDGDEASDALGDRAAEVDRALLAATAENAPQAAALVRVALSDLLQFHGPIESMDNGERIVAHALRTALRFLDRQSAT